MHVVANLRLRFDRLYNVFLEVTRMRRRKPHPPNSLNVGDGQQQLRETHPSWRRICIRINRLSEKLNFGVALVSELPDFPQDRIASSAALRAPRVRHDAVRARFVATF